MSTITRQSFPPYFHNILLILIAIISIGPNYERHSLAGLSPSVMKALEVNRSQFGLLFSSQDIPGIVLPAFSGLALTYVPHGPAAVVLACGILASTIITTIAIYCKSYTSLAFARLIFGFCDVSLSTLRGALVFHWFKGRFGSSFGWMLLISRLSSFLGLSLPTLLCERFGLLASTSASILICFPSFLATVVYTLIAARYCLGNEPVTVMDETLPLLADLEVRGGEGECDEPEGVIPLEGAMKIISSLPLPFGVLCYVWSSIGGSIFSLIDFAPDAISEHFSGTQAGVLTGGLMFITGLTCPAFGMLQDRIGKRRTFLMMGCASVAGGMFLWVYALGDSRNILLLGRKNALAGGLLFLSIGFAAVSVTLVSSIGLMVSPIAVPFALGVHDMSLSGFLAVSHACIGAMRDYMGSYRLCFGVLAGFAVTGVAGSSYLGAKVPAMAHGSDQEKRNESYERI